MSWNIPTTVPPNQTWISRTSTILQKR
nr:unnamed protein product [Callosobruchus chinensis]